MSISEIESILQSLRTRHPDLDAKMLEVLLLAGGWDSSIIRDTLLLYKTGERGSSSLPKEQVIPDSTPSAVVQVDTAEIVSEKKNETPVIPESVQEIITPSQVPPLQSSGTNDLVYITNDGAEEGELVTDSSTPEDLKREIAEPEKIPEIIKGINSDPKEVLIPSVNVPDPLVEKVEAQVTEVHESLVVPQEVLQHNQDVEIPSNLPLKPFESTPHVWSFSKYKDVFYGEVMPPITGEEKSLKETPSIPHYNVEKEPLTRKDEGLVFLAGSMLLVIILLLGYMYSNGRL